MSNENALREELEKERRKREELEQREIKIQRELEDMKKILSALQHEIIEKKANIAESPVSIGMGGNKAGDENKGEAITDLHFTQVSPSGSSNGLCPNNTGGSSSSFVVLGRNSTLSSPGYKEAQCTRSGSDSQSLGNVIVSEKEHERNPSQSGTPVDSQLLLCTPGSMENSPELEQLKSHHDAAKSAKGNSEKSDTHKANSWLSTGARPKNNSFAIDKQSVRDINEKKFPSEDRHLSPPGTEPEVNQNSAAFVQIPKDGGTYRINHFPPFDYGQDISMTGLSSVLSNNEDLSPRSQTQVQLETEALQFNDLNSGTSSSCVKSLPSQGELMSMPGVGTILDEPPRSRDAREHELLLMSFSSPFQSVNSKDAMNHAQVSSDDDLNLASQLNSLILEMKSKVLNTEEDLDRFAKYSEEVAKLESRLKNCQAEIQKHQVYSSSLQGQGAEVQRLRAENEELRQMLDDPQQHHNLLSSGLEPGWVSVTGNETEPKQEETTAVEEKLREVSALNNKLFSVNKEWEESWTLREVQFSSQQEDMKKNFQQLMKENQQLKEQADLVNQLRDELKKMKHEKHEIEQKMIVQESHLHKEKKMNDQIKAKLDVYAGTRGGTEMKVKDLLNKISELKSDTIALKQQLTTAMQDFSKEKKDKTMLEDQLKKLRAERVEQKRNDSKLKSANLMIKKREEEISSKEKRIGELQRMIDDLNAQLRTAERRTVLQPPSLFPSSRASDAFYPSASPAYNPNQMKLLQQQNEIEEITGEIPVSSYPGPNETRLTVASAEHSPDSWACANCTFINYSHKNNCEMCHSARFQDNSMLHSFSTLYSRDEWPGRDVPDSTGQIDVD